jgi:hypothetical protein
LRGAFVTAGVVFATGAAGAALATGALTTGAVAAFLAAAGGGAITGLAVGGGAAATAPRRGFCAAVSSSLRCWIARNTSPGLEIFDRSIFGFGSAAAALELDFTLVDRTGAPPPKCARTRAVSSSVSELEWVFFSPKPMSVRASINDLLFTSSSFANSLIRTFVIRPLFPDPVVPGSVTSTVHIEPQAQRVPVLLCPDFVNFQHETGHTKDLALPVLVNNVALRRRQHVR